MSDYDYSGVEVKTINEIVNFIGLNNTFDVLNGGWCAYITKENNKYYFCHGKYGETYDLPALKYEVQLNTLMGFRIKPHRDICNQGYTKSLDVKKKLFDKLEEANQFPTDKTITFTYEELKELCILYIDITDKE